jgi:purine-binding chemotaxis protein CheW
MEATAVIAEHQSLSAIADAEGGKSLLRMSVGTEVLAVPIAYVREILEVSRLTPLPRTPDFVRGVMNLRGAVVPVLDLAARLGMPPTVLGRRSCIVVVEARHETDQAHDLESADESLEAVTGSSVIGLLVDAVFEVFDTPSTRIESVPSLGTRIPADHLAGMTRARGEVIGILALDHVLSAQAMSQLIAQYND